MAFGQCVMLMSYRYGFIIAHVFYKQLVAPHHSHRACTNAHPRDCRT